MLKCIKYYLDHDFFVLSMDEHANTDIETILIMIADAVVSKQQFLGSKTGNATSANDIERNALISAVQVACLGIFKSILRHKEWIISKRIVSSYAALFKDGRPQPSDDVLEKVARDSMAVAVGGLTLTKLLPHYSSKYPAGIRAYLFLAAENGSDELAQDAVSLLHRIFEGAFRSIKSSLKTYILEPGTDEIGVFNTLTTQNHLLRRITYGSQIDDRAGETLVSVFSTVTKLCLNLNGEISRGFQKIVHRSHYLQDIFDLLDQDFDDEELSVYSASNADLVVGPSMKQTAAVSALGSCFDQMSMINEAHYLASKDIFEELRNILRKPSIRFPAIAAKAAEAFVTCFQLPDLCRDVLKSQVEAVYDLFIEGMTEDKSHFSMDSTLFPVPALLDLMRFMASPALGLEASLEMIAPVERNVNMMYEVCLESNISDRQILFSLLKRAPQTTPLDNGKMDVVTGVETNAGTNNRHWLNLKPVPNRPGLAPRPTVDAHISLVEFLTVLASVRKSDHRSFILKYCMDELPLKESLHFLQCWTAGKTSDGDVQGGVNSKARFTHLNFINTVYISDVTVLMSKLEECETDIANVVKICIDALKQYTAMSVQAPNLLSTWTENNDRQEFIFYVLGGVLPFLSELLITDAWPNTFADTANPDDGGPSRADSSPQKAPSSLSEWEEYTDEYAHCMPSLTSIIPKLLEQVKGRLLRSGVDTTQVRLLKTLVNAGDAVRLSIGNLNGGQLVRMKKEHEDKFFKQVDKDKKFVLGYLDAQVFNNPTQSKSWTDTVVRKKKTTSGNEDALGLQNAFFPTASAVEDADSLAREKHAHILPAKRYRNISHMRTDTAGRALLDHLA